MSLALGGPSTSLFEECIFNTLLNPDIDMMTLSTGEHLCNNKKKLKYNFVETSSKFIIRKLGSSSLLIIMKLI